MHHVYSRSLSRLDDCGSAGRGRCVHGLLHGERLQVLAAVGFERRARSQRVHEMLKRGVDAVPSEAPPIVRVRMLARAFAETVYGHAPLLIEPQRTAIAFE